RPAEKNYPRTSGGGGVKTLLHSVYRPEAGCFHVAKHGRLSAPAALAILILAGKLLAADLPADFSAANRLYAQGRFSDAAEAYEKLLQTGAQSPALLFNYANAEFKSGHLGRAIAAYRQAELLAPRD